MTAAGAPRRLARLARLARPDPVMLTGAALLGATALVAAVDPHTPGRYPLCPWHAMTGTWCPGCGGLRAVHDLTRGRLAAAAGENLLVVGLLAAVALWWVLSRLSPRGARAGLVLHRRGAVAVTVLALLFTVLRNLPVGGALAP